MLKLLNLSCVTFLFLQFLVDFDKKHFLLVLFHFDLFHFLNDLTSSYLNLLSFNVYTFAPLET